MAFKPTVDLDKCEGCEECVENCPSDVLEMKDDKAFVANEDECLGCETCIEVCEQGAITIEEI